MNKQNSRFEPVFALYKKYELEPEHAEQVNKLALQLFDCTQDVHELGDREREWLNAAALLHDIGWSQGGTSHHKASMKLILNNRFDGWTQEEQLVVANVARYHRKAAPKDGHKNYAALDDVDKEKVNKLAALLRIADGLDRSHGGVVEKLDCTIESDCVSLNLTCRRDLNLEHYGFEKKRDLFETVFGLRISIKNVKNAWDASA